MKAVVGVDSIGEYRPALSLLSRLDFLKATTTLLHVYQPSLLASDSVELDPEIQAAYAKATREIGRSALFGAMYMASHCDLNPSTKMISGNPAGALIAEAESELADVVAVCTTNFGEWGTTYLGKISQALAISCRSSVLIAKGELRSEGPLTAVLATDHSLFCERCLDRFLELHPAGIEHVSVASAFEIDVLKMPTLGTCSSDSGPDLDGTVEEIVEWSNERVCRKLTSAGYNATSRVQRGKATHVIRQAMKETHSDLVIVGSQGNGFIDRTLIGSVSLHQAIGEPYPVFIVRP